LGFSWLRKQGESLGKKIEERPRSGPVQKLARNLKGEEGKLYLEFGKGKRVFEERLRMFPTTKQKRNHVSNEICRCACDMGRKLGMCRWDWKNCVHT